MHLAVPYSDIRVCFSNGKTKLFQMNPKYYEYIWIDINNFPHNSISNAIKYHRNLSFINSPYRWAWHGYYIT